MKKRIEAFNINYNPDFELIHLPYSLQFQN